MRFEDAMYEVLRTRRYDRLMGRTRDIFGMIADFIERVMERLFDRLNLTFPEGMGGGRTVSLIFAAAAIILTVTGLVVVARIIWRTRLAKKHNLSDIFEELAQNDYTVMSLLHMSDTAQEQRVAVRYRYIAVLLALDEAGIIRLRPSMTGTIILRELKKTAAPLANNFEKIAYIYHLAWFGHREVADTGYQAFCAACAALIGTNTPPPAEDSHA